MRYFLLLLFLLLSCSESSPPKIIYSADVDVSGYNLVSSLTGSDNLYALPIITSDIPFNYLVPEWEANIPEGATLRLRIQTAFATGLFGEWQDVTVDADTSDARNDFYAGSAIEVSEPNTLHNRAVVEITATPNDNGEFPQLNRLSLVYIDSLSGTAQDVPEYDVVNQIQSTYPKPPVISRAQWCNHPSCNYTGVAYEPVTHLVVHHTVSDNHISDWMTNVRAIWIYHTFQRDWGDIGYNYLIDPDGNIYEGHLGGDNVIGTHAAAANRGGMGIALLGNFNLTEPSPAMLGALVELLAWKADQNNIDLWDASFFQGLDHGSQHLIGHKDVYGTTACPGALAHARLSSIRARVATKIGFKPAYTYVDERSKSFTSSDANWYDGVNSCGFNQHSFYTYSTSGSIVNYAEWDLGIDSAGRYEIDAYVPFCYIDTPVSSQSSYTVNSSSVILDQSNFSGMWMPLGEFNIADNGKVSLNDSSDEDGKLIYFDALRYRKLDAQTAPIHPTENQILTERTIQFEWVADDPATRLQVATDSEFNSLIKDVEFSAETNSSTQTFSKDYPQLYWRINDSAPTLFSIDATPPSSHVSDARRLPDGSYLLQWGGGDNHSVVASYNIEYSNDGVEWKSLFKDTFETEGIFEPDDPDEFYLFRSQATDLAGNKEAIKPDGDFDTSRSCPSFAEAIDLQHPVEWVNKSLVTFQWIGSPYRCVLYASIEVASDIEFKDVLMSHEIEGGRSMITLDLGGMDEAYWRVTEYLDNSSETSHTRRVSFDNTPPLSQIAQVHHVDEGEVEISATGEDNRSGVATYIFEYQVGDQWKRWSVEETGVTTFYFDSTKTYKMRVFAVDIAGNIETPSSDVTIKRHSLYLPIIHN